MLTKAMRKYVESNNKTGYDKHKQEVYDDRLVMYANQALKDFKLLAEKLPEEKLAQIFNVEKMKPFFDTLFYSKSSRLYSQQEVKEYQTWQNSEEAESRRKRLVKLSQAVLNTVGRGDFVIELLPELKPYLREQFNIASPENLKFMLYAQPQE
jgi:hypothetical protein